jgi:hypothetical protein
MKTFDFDVNQSLQTLEGVDWGEPTYDSSLVIDCHRLRRVALKDFTDDDLARMIVQQIGLPYLVPMALEAMRQRPCSSGELYFGGTLLSAVLSLDANFWSSHPKLARAAFNVIEGLPARIASLQDFECVGVQDVLDELSPVFLRRAGFVNP